MVSVFEHMTLKNKLKPHAHIHIYIHTYTHTNTHTHTRGSIDLYCVTKWENKRKEEE